MSNQSKQKGTSGETEVVRRAAGYGLEARRTPAGARHDVDIRGGTGRTIQSLATRPDRGRWLVTIDLDDFLHLLAAHGDSAVVEVKRYARFAHHSIFEEKFSGPQPLLDPGVRA